MHRDRRGQPRLMRRARPQPANDTQPKRRQVGAKIDEDLWDQIRKVAIDQHRPAAEVLDDAMRLYLEQAKP